QAGSVHTGIIAQLAGRAHRLQHGCAGALPATARRSLAMNQTADFAATHYGPRAQDYVASAVHGSGADLDQIAATLQGHADARVLDLGCGGGHVGYRVAPLVREVVACDPTASMLEAV